VAFSQAQARAHATTQRASGGTTMPQGRPSSQLLAANRSSHLEIGSKANFRDSL